MGKRVIAVIPARMASSRYPGKPLAMILGLPMVEHVRRRALLARGIDEAVVATCDQEIMDIVTKAGGKAVMTSDSHEWASERVESADLMRVLEHGYRILGVPTDHSTIGVDHDFDVPIIENILRTDPAQQALHRRVVAAAPR